MDKANLKQSRMDMIHSDDEQLAKLLEHLDKNVLNVRKWDFNIASLDKDVTYHGIVELLNVKHPDLTTVEVIKDAFLYLPKKFKNIKDELWTVFKRFALNLQERLKYMQELEEENENLKLQLQEYQEAEQDLRIDIEEIKESIELLRSNTLPKKVSSPSKDNTPPNKKQIFSGEETPSHKIIEENTDQTNDLDEKWGK